MGSLAMDEKKGVVRMIKTLVSVPTFDMVHTDFMESVVNLQKPEGSFFTVVKNTLIHDARNIIAGNAINAGFDRILWLDSDMKLPKDAFVKLSKDMDNFNIDFVSALYFTRKPPNIKPVAYKTLKWNLDGDVLDADAENLFDYTEGLQECAATGFGCVLTTTALIRRVWERFGSPFNPLESMGEDLSFCWRAGQIGEKLFLDARVKCGHIGAVEINEDYYRGTHEKCL